MIAPQRLRDLADTLDGDDWRHPLGSADLCRQAADEVERLRDFVRSHSCLCVGDVRCNRCKLLEGER